MDKSDQNASGYAQSTFQGLFTVDLRTLALFRVLLGSIVLWNFVTLAFYVKPFYSHEGLLPALYVFQTRYFSFSSLFFINDTATVALLLIGLGILSTLAFIVGWKTRWTCLWMTLFLYWLETRNPLAVHGPDRVLRYLAFFAIFIPFGDKFAWDAPSKAARKTECSYAIMALMLLPCVVYLAAFVFKLQCANWVEGSAMEGSLANAWSATTAGTFLLNFPGLLYVLNYGTLVLEVIAPLMLLCPFRRDLLRTLALLSLTSLQLGIFLTIDVLNFPPIMVLSTVPFIPSGWWDWVGRFKPMRDLGRRAALALDRPDFLGPPPKPASWERPLRTGLEYTALGFTLLLFYYALTSFDPGFSRSKDAVYRVTRGFILTEKWAAFSPEGRASNYNTWPVVVATLKDGTQRDILNDKPVVWERPIPYVKGNRDGRWAVYTRQAFSNKNRDVARLRGLFLKYIFEEWNAKHAGGSKAVKVELYDVTQTIRPAPGPLTKNLVIDHPRASSVPPDGQTPSEMPQGPGEP